MKLTTIYYGSDIIRYTVQTFGCKVNQYESASVAKAMDEHGYEKTDDIFTADIVIINSCSVTENSDKKAKQLINRIKSNDPMKIVVLTGCFPQAFPETASKLSADIVTGTEHKDSIADMIDVFTGNKVKQVAIPPRPVKKQYEKQKNADMGKTRAFIKIEDGCDRFCSYCIIPTARGSVRSRSLQDITEEVRFQVSCGHKEMVLVGINLSCYGQEIGLRLADAIEAVCSVDGVERVRLSSLEPELLTDEDIARMAAQKKLCPHFHLSLQSGCDATLKRMNRKYDTATYEAGCKLIRKYFTHPAITTDVIVGFPGETEEEFEATKEFLERIHFYEMHIFKYSKRKGTKAAVMPDQVPEQVKTERSKVLLALAQEMSEEFREYYVGRPEEILLEETDEIAGNVYFTGYTKEYVKIAVPEAEGEENILVKGVVTGRISADVYRMENIEKAE